MKGVKTKFLGLITFNLKLNIVKSTIAKKKLVLL